MGFLENHCWHLWFLIASEWEEVIFADDTATEASGNEVGRVVSEVFQKAAEKLSCSAASSRENTHRLVL